MRLDDTVKYSFCVVSNTLREQKMGVESMQTHHGCNVDFVPDKLHSNQVKLEYDCQTNPDYQAEKAINLSSGQQPDIRQICEFLELFGLRRDVKNCSSRSDHPILTMSHETP